MYATEIKLYVIVALISGLVWLSVPTRTADVCLYRHSTINHAVDCRRCRPEPHPGQL